MDPQYEPGHDNHSSSNSLPNNNSNNNHKINSNHGVADYFAVLGIGEDMVLKSTQKKNCYASEQQQDMTEEEKEAKKRQEDEEEECYMVQRFYREITDVGILTITAPTNNNSHVVWNHSSSLWELSTSNNGESNLTTSSSNLSSTYLPNHLNFSPLLPSSSSFATIESKSHQLPTTTTNNDSTSDTHQSNSNHDADNNNISGKKPVNESSLNEESLNNGSPPRSCNSTIDGSTANNHEVTNSSSPKIKPKQNQRPVDVAGYTVIWDTLPAGKESSLNDRSGGNNQNNSYCQSVNDSTMDESFCDSHPNMKNNYNSNHNRENNRNNDIIAWTKGQIHNADLNPIKGLRGSLISVSIDDNHLFDCQSQHNETINTTKNYIINRSNNMDKYSSLSSSFMSEKSKQNSHDGKNNNGSTSGGRLSDFGRKVRNHLAPIVSLGSHAASATHLHSRSKDQLDIEQQHKGLNKQHYVVYRRRGADETHRPAIADIALEYVRIHTDTIIHTSSSSQSTNNNGNTSNASNHNEEDTNDLKNSDNNKYTERKDDKLLHTGIEDGQHMNRTAQLRKGFATGAAIAARVAASGRNRLRNIQTSNSKDIDNTEIPVSSPPENSIPSPRLTRKYFFPTKNVESKEHHDSTMKQHQRPQHDDMNDNSHNYREIHLCDMIPLPEGYDEWVIPNEYKTLQIPTPHDNSNNNINDTYEFRKNNSSHSNHSSTLAEDDKTGAGLHTTYDCNDVEEDLEKLEERRAQRRIQKTHIIEQQHPKNYSDMNVEKDLLLSPSSQSSGLAIEAHIDGNTFLKRTPTPKSPSVYKNYHDIYSRNNVDPYVNDEFYVDYNGNDKYSPLLVSVDELPTMYNPLESAKGDGVVFEYLPVIAIRRQRVTDEERYHEDSAIVDIGVSFLDSAGIPVALKNNDDILSDDEDDEESDNSGGILTRTKWSASSYLSQIRRNNEDNMSSHSSSFLFHQDSSSFLEQSYISSHDINDHDHNHHEQEEEHKNPQQIGYPVLLSKRNVPLGFADTPFATTVLDRFPQKNYKGLPLPEEELPMFCYPTGCRLYRTMYQDVPIAQCYGFVVKNERGDSIYVSCVSFMEPLTKPKIEKLNRVSEKRRRTSLPHRFYCEKRERTSRNSHKVQDEKKSSSFYGSEDTFVEETEDGCVNRILTGFDEMTTFENKTICLVGRYPYWTAFRRFLSNLHILSGSSSELPLERWISHLLLEVPVPKLGDQCIIVPLPTLAGPMIMSNPPAKDFPLVDLPFQRLLSCLDVPTIVTIVLSFLALEKKVIIMSTYPSMVSDVCELLRALLFPFDLCAPYVPRLTEPFMSCLDFPGAIFVGIHDDGSIDGLASMVRKNIPEDTAVVDIDTGEIDCSEHRYEELKSRWSIMPTDSKSELVFEIEALCRDAGIVPGQEQIDSHLDIAYDENLSLAIAEELKDENECKQEVFDERGLRDCFLRFFCSILGGYERFLVVPDMDFLISGNEWFDSEGFLASVSPNKKQYLSSFVSTQMFQSFIQKRTEASDVQCLLFDECLSEYHSTKHPYGRLGINEEIEENGNSVPHYNLLVDQCAAELVESDAVSSTDHSVFTYNVDANGTMTNNNGDIMTSPSHYALHPNSQFVYCTDGNPCFPSRFNDDLFYPKEPDQLSAHLAEIPVPILTRNERELDDARRREKMIISHRGVQKQRRCLWQLPKLMGSHVLGSWLMCIPNQISQTQIGSEQQEKFLLRALGALRVLRSRQRIVPDEASYRCLMVACGRCNSDRRVELVKLFGLLRSEGIFPSAVTLGQYTRAIAEGFSKQSSGTKEQSNSESFKDEVTASRKNENNSKGNMINIDLNTALASLDSNLELLEISGRRWRQRRDSTDNEMLHSRNEGGDETASIELKNEHIKNTLSGTNQQLKRRHRKSWSPILCSSSFSPHWKPSRKATSSSLSRDFQFVSMWSRTSSCTKCHYIPLDEEIQGGWSNSYTAYDSNDVQCPVCGNNLQPVLGYHEMTMDQVKDPNLDKDIFDGVRQSRGFPSQLTTFVTQDSPTDKCGFVPYLSPSKMRHSLEKCVEEYGEEVLERTMLRRVAPIVFYNLWWFSARFSLPLPLTIESSETSESGGPSTPVSYPNQCAFISWDKNVAEEGCRSAAKAVLDLIESFQIKSSRNDRKEKDQNDKIEHQFYYDDFPLLTNFNINSFAQCDWDHPDFSKILVRLVEACDKREFQSVITCIRQCNHDRRKLFENNRGTVVNRNENELALKYSDLECYKTLLYLVRYQCTTAFHVFFPTSMKGCKGYHYWCPIGTPLPIFDRMFLDAMSNSNSGKDQTPWHQASDVALGFRCIFGHII